MRALNNLSKQALFKYALTCMLVILFLLTSCSKRPEGLDKRLKTYRYPYKTKVFKYLSQTQKLEMAYMYVTPKDESKRSDKVFLLIHGKNFSGAYFETTIKALKDMGHTVIVPDLVGFGRSSKPLKYQYTLHGLAHSLKKLIDWYKIEKVHILGHSMGGMVASRFALMFPEATEKLYLLNPIGLEDYRLFTPYIDVDTLYQKQLAQTEKKLKNYQLKNYYDGRWKEGYNRWLRIQAGWVKGPDWRQLAYISALTYEMIYTQPIIYELNTLKVKTALIIGDRDKTALGRPMASKENKKKMGNYKLLAPKINKLIPNSELYTLKGIGHLPHIESFDQFLQAFKTAISKH